MHFLVTTSINIPRLLTEYIRDFAAHGHEYCIVIAGDKKSPAAAAQFCRSLPNTVYLDVGEQAALFNELPLHRYVPYNSIDRRNFAYLYCAKQGITPSDTVITIDDDNFLSERDFLGNHSHRTRTGLTVTADRPTWFNPLPHAYLESLYPRGFSMFERAIHTTPVTIRSQTDTVPLAINQGLWNESPDLDAISRFIEGDAAEHTVRDNASIILGANVLCPFDTQNTAYLNGFWPTAFLCPFIGRFDDIFSSFITKRIADHLGYGLAFGSPVAVQHRNPHSTYRDFLLELHGMSLTDTFVNLLYTIDITARTPIDAFAELADTLAKRLTSYQTLHHGTTAGQTKLWSLNQIPIGMKLWLDSLEQLNVNTSAPAPAIAHAAP
ncbi:MAG: hypothetical protein COT71_01790 [Candidatus Andersenbacteria bacterium CG10_big_fil_rev_8_21_14_0_10_54_11]|uniref:DUF288 domain-containing protein n=1 Tax=Candidatus Andersenbacteria bacterium CG10_big_fil_rev_8_21_14_0_10_54_11 TaxID=1974485 RepID=A0A2M6WZP4_9BACT|nr:MAG: hypothetical protein COT71_01790 [Candidatus Andersenbacteria bacterium CG10_big_fil_rev_8_21_14_0_10_54_11]